MIINKASKIYEHHLEDAKVRQHENSFLTFGNIGNTGVNGLNVTYYMITNKIIILK